MEAKANCQLTLSEVMTPDKVNFSGHIHGGYLMLLLDKVAYACAARFVSGNVVTLSADQILFKKPIFVGELVTCLAQVNYVGNTSLEIGVRVIAENLIKGEQRHTNTCYFTMVAVDEQGKPRKITQQLQLKTEVDRYRCEEAKLRKELRQKYYSQHTSDKEAIRARQGG